MSKSLNQNILDGIREWMGEGFIPLHRPKFIGNEKSYLERCIDSTYVSSIGEFVDEFEKEFAKKTQSKYAVCCVNGTNALHIALLLNGVEPNDEVVTQAFSFVATANAISYTNAYPAFVDIERESMGMDPDKLQYFFTNSCEWRDGAIWNKQTKRRVRACVPMHTFGLPSKIQEIKAVCEEFNVRLVEDAAEAVGSEDENGPVGKGSVCATFSFNGNKIITTGGGGMVVTSDEKMAKQAKHLTTQAKIPHQWEFKHDAVGFNFRMPNLNAALGLAQLESLNDFIKEKRALAHYYAGLFSNLGVEFVKEREGCQSNYWLNAILFNSKTERDEFLKFSNQQGVMTRPAWNLLSELPMFSSCHREDLTMSFNLQDKLVNIPSSVR
jgi:perosamine synthetase